MKDIRKTEFLHNEASEKLCRRGGVIIPADLGNPSLNIAKYRDVETILKPRSAELPGNFFDTTHILDDTSQIPTKIILPIFTPTKNGKQFGATTWTEGTRVVNGTIAPNARNPLAAKSKGYHCTAEWKEGTARFF